MNDKPITLHELLASRDARHAMQLRLMAEHSGKTLVCLTVVMPGSVKRNRQSLTVAHAAVDAIRDAFGIARDGCSSAGHDVEDMHTENDAELIERDLPTGYEAYLLTSMPLLDAKRMAVDIENTHPLGRLFDIDVIDKDGAPVSREMVGNSPRRCIVCDRDARYCMRMRWHTQDEIWARINDMVEQYSYTLNSITPAKDMTYGTSACLPLHSSPPAPHRTVPGGQRLALR